jgi:hypothetical protein
MQYHWTQMTVSDFNILLFSFSFSFLRVRFYLSRVADRLSDLKSL